MKCVYCEAECDPTREHDHIFKQCIKLGRRMPIPRDDWTGCNSRLQAKLVSVWLHGGPVKTRLCGAGI